MDDDLILCRCEEITVGEIRAAITRGAMTVPGIKRRTRAGMGLCQGRTCSVLLSRVLAGALARPIEDFPPDTARPPVRPFPLGVLAEEDE